VSFPAYESYKESGIEWLGQVPSHWTFAKLKHLGRFNAGAGFPHEDQGVEGDPLPFHKVNALGHADALGYLTESENTVSYETAARLRAHVFPPGSIVFAKIGAALLLGRIRRLRTHACIDNNLMGFTHSAPHSPQFLRHLFSLVRFDFISNPGAVPSINEGQVANVEVAVPPVAEQRAIAAFLDRETAKIDALVEAQERLIALLKEKRQAVISHAVTKGLDPSAPMKDSGVEWLGQVPAHWEVCLLKRAFSEVDYGISDTLDADDGVAVLRMGNIQDGEIDLTELKYVTSVDDALLLRPLDLLFNRTNSLDQIGKVGLLREPPSCPTSFASYLVRLRLTPSCSPPFMAKLLNTRGILGEARARAFVAIGQCNLNPTRYGEIAVALPPLGEQERIAAHLEDETKGIDALLSAAKAAITLLQERRAALISAAVTGKIDVRGLVQTAEAA
jgi:type I restriction enzyme S subunit